MDQKVKEKYRCFTFTHYKLSTIQQGIQPLHAGIELMLKYNHNLWEGEELPVNKVLVKTELHKLVIEWATKHKTVVCKNGGDSVALNELSLTLSNQTEYPWAQFNESEADMMDMLTSIAIIVPVEIYDEGVRLMRNRKLEQIHANGLWTIFNEHGIPFEYTDFEWNLMTWIKECHLAR